MVMFVSIVVTISYALYGSYGPVAEPHFGGRLDITKVYQWTSGPNPQIIYVKDLPTSFYAVAATKVGWKGRCVYGASSSGTLTKPDGTTIEIVLTGEGGGVGGTIPITEHAVLDATPYTYRTQKSYSGYVSESTPSSTYTVSMTGRGLVKEAEPSWKFDASIAGHSLNIEYKSGGSVSFSMTEVSGSKSHTVGTTESRPDSYECEHEKCEVALPRRDYHKVDCPHKIPRAFNRGQKDCPGYTWTCQSDSVCEHVDDHLESCAGGCGDLLHSSRKYVHREECTPASGEPVGSYGAGNHYYYDCTQEARDEHKRINGQCGHRYRNCVKGDHDQWYTSCPVSITQNGQTVYCNASTPGWKCEHTHNFPDSSTSSSSTDNTSSTSNADETVETKTCTRRVPKRVRRRINGRWRWVTRMLPCGESFTDDDNDYGDCVPGKKHRE